MTWDAATKGGLFFTHPLSLHVAAAGRYVLEKASKLGTKII